MLSYFYRVIYAYISRFPHNEILQKKDEKKKWQFIEDCFNSRTTDQLQIIELIKLITVKLAQDF